MSMELFKGAYEGAVTATSYAEILLAKAIKVHGADCPVKYPDTAYRLPVITALSGEEVNTIGDLAPILNRIRTTNIKEELTLENAKLNGEATLYAAEIIEALRYLKGVKPDQYPYCGFVPDPILRKFGVPLVDQTIPGVAVIVGKGKDSKSTAKMVKDLQAKGIMIFLVNEVIEQCIEENVKIGAEFITFPLGNFTQVIHAVNFAFRAGLAFGGIPAGQRERAIEYQAKRVFAFVIQLGPNDVVKYAAEFGAMFMGFPTVTDQPVAEEIPDWYQSEPDYEKIVKLGLELRGIKLKIVDIPVPITIGPAFEGETIRKKDAYVEFGGGRSTSFELVRMCGVDEVEDGKIEVIGPEIDEMPEGSIFPLGFMVDIYGRKMQEDFEGVLERRIHYNLNYGEGLWHVAQRNMMWVRIGKNAHAAGFKIRDFGEILIAKFKSDFPAIVDRVQVTIITDKEVIEDKIKIAIEKYAARDARLKGLTDDVETYYSCTLCQSFAPNHVCVVSPERLGLCGAVSWLDAKASNEINPLGPNQPIDKGECLDTEKGQWKNLNDFIYANSHNTVEAVNFYTLMENPMTSCGCFEAIMAILPMCNGIMITTREHGGETPCGMTFSALAGTCGGGMQTPGFMGLGRRYITSKKFIKADGGLARLVWMPKELKEFLGQDLIDAAEHEGLGADFVDKIADETVGTTEDEILPFLEEKQHPALKMDPMM
ncbi:acetyl-CoA decarbonylase/synthase complex subunit alpha/beta [Sporomusa acidovorans]|uniref:CO-methylating acetyl-CoA synthase n=1 Tax=Sporomusa acidovorans (strain ATCC 49682 / DSM 3132 / Mol) TaxID=1123286 RepID=A0ABZ3J1T1_SPOA4|nr:acetyl-CoA decarbonylase/synthase complex subunit alpha/beta [Sporomusa acidovorans]OZC22439.1 carbon monoxide dehydrogenase/acetyl-CoA synthase subunit alpha [Sporomusa acidovorans DSM 3132]SDE74860.1 CO-methylating acetyl-CoA synthase precursor /acetyl-CoA decarbonylase/synthase beta subunit [Sporomusa acidovorans]